MAAAGCRLVVPPLVLTAIHLHLHTWQAQRGRLCEQIAHKLERECPAPVKPSGSTNRKDRSSENKVFRKAVDDHKNLLFARAMMYANKLVGIYTTNGTKADKVSGGGLLYFSLVAYFNSHLLPTLILTCCQL